MTNKKNTLIFIIIIVILFICSGPIFAIQFSWITPPGNDFNISSANGFKDVYLKTYRFRVNSDKSYNVDISIEPYNWNASLLQVVMDVNNDAVDHTQDFSAAFEVAVTNSDGTWQQFKTGGSNVSLLYNQPATDNAGRVHKLAVALVLVDQDTIMLEGNAINLSSGTNKCRRFKNLPANNYSTDLNITVTENLD